MTITITNGKASVGGVIATKLGIRPSSSAFTEMKIRDLPFRAPRDRGEGGGDV